jgi:hypothetical protein
VYNHEKRGRSADIFSRGCVFLEILTAIRGIDLHYFTDARRGDDDDDDESFHANLERVVGWARENLCESSHHLMDAGCAVFTNRVLDKIVELAISMIATEPWKRPVAEELFLCLDTTLCQNLFSLNFCCLSPPEPYEVYTTSNTGEN